MDRYLDPEQKFYNYRTAEIDDNQIFDINKASNSWSQNFIDDPIYMRDQENAEMQIVHMTPREYWEICARDVFNKPVKQLMNQWRTLDAKTLEHLTQVILKYKKRFPITYINYASHNHPSQEGLHRMIVAGDLFGWDTEFPVMVIKWADEEKAAQEKANKRKNEVENNISRAIDKALRYKYYNLDDLKDQLYSEIQYQLKYDDEFEDKEFTLDLVDSGDEVNPGLLVIVDNKYECFISYDDIQIQVQSLEADFNDEDINDLDDLDITDLDWLNLNESMDVIESFLTSKSLQKQLAEEFGSGYAAKPICNKVCKFIKDLEPRCEMLDFMIAVWKLDDHTAEPISVKGHCVIRYNNKLYDYTSHQFDDYGIDVAKTEPRILIREADLDEFFGADAYADGNYVITVF